MNQKWSDEQRAKYRATVARKKAERAAAHNEEPRHRPQATPGRPDAPAGLSRRAAGRGRRVKLGKLAGMMRSLTIDDLDELMNDQELAEQYLHFLEILVMVAGAARR